MYALIDCNNFFVSCERVFDPRLWGRPVAVLSNNDGCVVSRSQEVKDLDVPMGAPLFKYRDVFKRHNVAIRSANFSIYGDLSNRVMKTLEIFSDDIEVYSIDEAFLKIGQSEAWQLIQEAQEIKQTIWQHVGIPVSIGIGHTKTQAKLAAHIAKKNPQHNGVYFFDTVQKQAEIISEISVREVWGIGRRLAQTLRQHGIYSVLQLCQQNERWLKKILGTSGYFHILELKGQQCMQNVGIRQQRKSIISSRSFGRPVESLQELHEAMVTYTTIAAQKLRRQNLQAGYLGVYIATNRFRDAEYYSQRAGIQLERATANTFDLVAQADELLQSIFRPNKKYKRLCVSLYDLHSSSSQQLDLFTKHQQHDQKEQLMQVVDTVNRRYGSNSLYLLGQGIQKKWRPKSAHRSVRFTTSWNELLEVG